tara:strand:- start:920 stop:1114 length:195 start_codon:yes stop_codon:yes gene_type:complete
MKWKAIKTMPRGETILLRLSTGQIILGGIISGRLIVKGYGYFDYLPLDTILTHWCELPELPKEE